MIIPRLPILTYLLNRTLRYYGGVYKIHKDIYIHRKLLPGVWYHAATMSPERAKNFVYQSHKDL